MTKKQPITEEKGMDENLQEKLMEMQLFDQQARQLQKYIEAFDEQLTNVKGLIESVKEMGSQKAGQEIYAPLANGIFIKARLEEPSKLLINVGNGVVVEKTIAETVALLEGQESEVQKFRKEAEVQLAEFTEKLASFE